MAIDRGHDRRAVPLDELAELKKPSFSEQIDGVGGTGLEPVTSTV
jgi:hypothetical protein